jgi:hypothetical protein
MIGGLRTSALVAIGSAVVAGLAGTAVAIGGRSADTQLLRDERHPPRLTATAVEHGVRSAPDPFTGKGEGVSARCSSGRKGRLGNPWTCTVSFKSGKRAGLRVTVSQDGTWTGRYRDGSGASANGCCIDLPGAR